MFTYASLLQTLAFLLVAPLLTRLNHLHTRRSSTILLGFYPLYLAAALVGVRTSFALWRTPIGSGGGEKKLGTAIFAVGIAHAGTVFVSWILECFGPERDDEVEGGYVTVKKNVKESPYVTANIYSRQVYCYFRLFGRGHRTSLANKETLLSSLLVLWFFRRT